MPSKPRGEPFFTILAVLQLVTVLAGFAPSFYARPESLPPLSSMFAWHGAILTLWYVFVIVQSGLLGLRYGKTTLRVHMALGMLSLVLAVAIIYSGSVVAFDFYHAGSKVEILSPDGLLVANLMNLFGFFVCFTAGIAKRKKPELHKRFLTLAGVVMIGPAAFRLVVNCGLAPPFSLLVQFGFVAAMFAYDRRRLRRTSPATWIAAGLIVLLIAVTLAVG